MEILRKYGVATNIYIPIIKAAARDFALSADWTPAAGDVKISKDGGAAANVTTLPVAITMGNGAMWNFALSATEMQAAKISVTVIDAATKAVEDQMIMIGTYGNAAAEHAVDLDDAVRAGLTALPNAAAEAAGGLYTRGSGAGQIAQDVNGRVDTRMVAGATDAITATVIAADAIGSSEFAQAAADKVWSSATRTLTAFSTALALAVWDVLESSIVTASSIGLKVKNNLDAAVSSRLAAAGYTAPDNTTIGTINSKLGAFTATGINTVLGFFRAMMRKDATLTPSDVGGTFDNTTDAQEATKDNQLDAAVSTRAPASTAVSNADYTAARAAKLDNADVATSTRLATAGYTAPDNAGIAAILADTGTDGVVVAAGSKSGYALTVAEHAAISDKLLGRNIAGGSDAGRKVSEALAFLRNKWEIVGTTLTVYAADDVTPLFTATIARAAADAVISSDPA